MGARPAEPRQRLARLVDMAHQPDRQQKISPGRLLIIGLGNDYRGDDGLGLAAVRRLREMNLPGISVLEAEADAGGLLELWQGADTVILLDAVSSRARPGAVFRFEAHLEPLPQKIFASCSTHALGLAEAIELARALGRLPPRLIVYGIVGQNFAAGSGLSPEARPGVEEAVSRVLRQLTMGGWSGTSISPPAYD